MEAKLKSWGKIDLLFTKLEPGRHYSLLDLALHDSHMMSDSGVRKQCACGSQVHCPSCPLVSGYMASNTHWKIPLCL